MSFSTRQMAILTYCETPRTMKELCTKFEVSHMTIRKEIERLSFTGVLQEAPFRRKQEKLYKTQALSGDNLGAGNLSFREANFPPVALVNQDYLQIESALQRLSKVPRFVISKMITEYGLQEGWAIPHELMASSYPSVNQSKLLLQKAIEFLENFLELFQQVEELPAWEGKKFLYNLVGNPEKFKENREYWMLIKESIVEFEQVINTTPAWEGIMGLGVLSDE